MQDFSAQGSGSSVSLLNIIGDGWLSKPSTGLRDLRADVSSLSAEVQSVTDKEKKISV